MQLYGSFSFFLKNFEIKVNISQFIPTVVFFFLNWGRGERLSLTHPVFYCFLIAYIFQKAYMCLILTEFSRFGES